MEIISLISKYFFKQKKKKEILFLEKISHDNIPIWLLYIPPLFVIMAIPISYYLFLR